MTYVSSKQVGRLLIGKRSVHPVPVGAQPVSKGERIPTAHLDKLLFCVIS